jgi:catechol 2,3-dioxygenase-like lactoylglutathione lyase family enzyme
MELDSAQIGADDVAAAARDYGLLLGVEPVARGAALRFQLGRGAVEIEPGAPGLDAIRFTAGTPLPPAAFHGIEVRVEAPAGPSPPAVAAPVLAIDHIVVQTPDAERAIALWRDQHGLRLALDRVFPARGLRLLFFRSGGVTLEYASPDPPPAERDGADRLHGLSYRVAHLTEHRERLLAAGMDVSPIRPGMRPGTQVASVRSRTAGVPTLLLEVLEPAPPGG